MPRSFDMAAEYDGSVEQVHQAFRDEQYWLLRLAESGVDDATLDELAVEPSGGVRVKTTQTVRSARLPAVASQFHRGDLSFVREETWTPVGDGRATGTVLGSIPGAPVTLSGEAALVPRTDQGSRLTLVVAVEVRVPLVGGKIENFIGEQLVHLLLAEQRFTTEWIADNG